MQLGLALKDFHLVAIRVGDKCHLAIPGGELLAPLPGPYLDAFLLQLITVIDDVLDSDSGVHEVLGECDIEIRGVGQLKEMIVARQVHECQLVALGRGFLFPQLEAEFLVKGNTCLRVGYADARVKEFDHACL